MGILRSMNDGTHTDLTSLGWGRDRQDGGSSNEPYLYKPLLHKDALVTKALAGIADFYKGGVFNTLWGAAIGHGWNFYDSSPFLNNGVKAGNIITPPSIGSSPDMFIRGGLAASARAFDDVRRLGRMQFDNKNVRGKLFRVKQLTLSRIAPKTPTSNNLFNAGTYSPMNTLLQAGGGWIGARLDKQGPLLATFPRYLDLLQDFGDNDDPRGGYTSRLAGLLYDFQQGLGEGEEKHNSLKNFVLDKTQDRFGFVNIYSYQGGPGSQLGFGKTNLRLSTDRNQVPIKLKPLSFNNFSDSERRTYMDNGASYRLRFLYKRQFNHKEWKDDTGFYQGYYFFNLATKNDGKTPLRTSPPQISDKGNNPTNFLNPWSYAYEYLKHDGIGDGALNAAIQPYLTIAADGSGLLDLTGFRFHGKEHKFGTTAKTGTPVRTFKGIDPGARQWSTQQIHNREGKYNLNNNFTDGNTQIPTSGAPKIQEDFRKKISLYENKLSYVTPNVKIDGRVNQGSPGGSQSKTAFRGRGSKIISHSSNTLTFPNNFKGITKEQLNKAVDKINAMPIYSSAALKPSSKAANNDLVHFAIGIVKNSNFVTSNYLHFRAFLNDVQDSYSSDWASQNYVGRSEKFYNFTGNFERSINTSFIVAAQSKAELIPMYKKLNFLASAIAGDYTANGYMSGNFMKLTIGGYVYEMPGFLKGITYTMKQGYPWEIGIADAVDPDTGEMLYDNSVKELCHYIEVSGFDFQVVHNFLPMIASDNPMNTGRRFISLRDGGGSNWSATGDLTGLETGFGTDGDFTLNNTTETAIETDAGETTTSEIVDETNTESGGSNVVTSDGDNSDVGTENPGHGPEEAMNC